MLKRFFAALCLLFAPALAFGQGAVLQQGGVFNGHNTMWIGNGYVADAGGPAGNGLAPINPVTGLLPLGAGYVNKGLGVCQFSAYASAPYSSMCWGFDGSGNGLITLGATGGGSPSLSVVINGISYPFPGTGAGNVIAPTSPFPTAGDVVLWNGTTAVKDGGLPLSVSAVGIYGLDPTGGTDSAAKATTASNAAMASGIPINLTAGTYLLNSQPAVSPLTTWLFSGAANFTGSGSIYGASANLTASTNAASGQNIIQVSTTAALQTNMTVTAQYILQGITGTQCIPNATTIQIIDGTHIGLYNEGTATPVPLACQINSGQTLYFSTKSNVFRWGPFFNEIDALASMVDYIDVHGYHQQSNGLVIQASSNASRGLGNNDIPIFIRSTWRGDDCLDFAEGTAAVSIGACGSTTPIKIVGLKYGDGGINGYDYNLVVQGGSQQKYQGIVGYAGRAVCNQADALAICNLHIAENTLADEVLSGTPSPTSEIGYIARLSENTTAHLASSGFLVGNSGSEPVDSVIQIGGFSGNNDFATGFDFAQPAGQALPTHFSTGNFGRVFWGDALSAVTPFIGGLRNPVWLALGGQGTGCTPGWQNVTVSGSGGGSGGSFKVLIAPNGMAAQPAYVVAGSGYSGTLTASAVPGCSVQPTFNIIVQQDQAVIGTTNGGSGGKLLFAGADTNSTVEFHTTSASGTSYGTFGNTYAYFQYMGGISVESLSGELILTPSNATGTTAGTGLLLLGGSVNDSTQAGTIAAQGFEWLGVPTFTASSGVTYTNSATLYVVGAPVASTNVTITNPWAIRVGTGASQFGPVVVGAPTGLSEGAGTINVQSGYYANGTAGVSCTITGATAHLTVVAGIVTLCN